MPSLHIGIEGLIFLLFFILFLVDIIDILGGTSSRIIGMSEFASLHKS